MHNNNVDTSDLITQVSKNSISGVAPSVQPKSQVIQRTLSTREDQLGPQPANKKGLKTLVLDLDETLVRSQFKEP